MENGLNLLGEIVDKNHLFISPYPALLMAFLSDTGLLILRA